MVRLVSIVAEAHCIVERGKCGKENGAGYDPMDTYEKMFCSRRQ